MKCLIVSNGNIENYNFYKKIIIEADLIICADGGAKHLVNMGAIPHIVIGDLDSIDEKNRKLFVSKKVKFLKFPVDKDATDTELATDFALSKNPSEIIYIGTIGSRMDHTLANIALLKKLLEKDVFARIINENNEIYLIDKEIELYGNNGDFISILPLTEKVTGITLKGLKFPLHNAEIRLGSSLGISNSFVDKKATIKIQSGQLLVIKARD